MAAMAQEDLFVKRSVFKRHRSDIVLFCDYFTTLQIRWL